MVDEDNQNAASEAARGAPINRDRPHDPGVIDGERAEPEPDASAGHPASSMPEMSRAGGLRPLLAGALGGLLALGIVGAPAYLFFSPKADLAEANAKRLGEVEAQVQRAGGEAQRQSAALASLEKRVGALETTQPGQALAALDKRESAVEAAVAADSAKVAQAAQAAQAAQGSASAAKDQKADVEAALARLPELETRLAKLEKAAGAPQAAAPEVADLENRVHKLEAALAAPKAETRAAAERPAAADNPAAVALVAGSLRDRLAAGAPFQTELAALQTLGVDSVTLAPLKGLAGGAPTDESLAASFDAVAKRVLDAAASRPEEGDAWGRLLAHIRGLVQERDLNETSGDDPAALVSQIEAETRRGDLHAALAAFAKLPEPARRAAADWAATASARLQADKIIQSIREAAIESLAAGGKS
jgi:hypothetical protein